MPVPLVNRVVLTRVIAAFAPVAIVCALLLMDKWPGQMPWGEIQQITQNRFYEGLPSLSPDGEWMAFRCDERGNGDICVGGLDGREVRNLTQHSTGDETEPAISPDGSQIAFQAAGGGISIVPAGGGEIRVLTTSGAEPAWTPDGRFIIYVVPAAGPGDPRAAPTEGWRVEVATGLRRRISPGDFHQPAVSPNNRRIAYWGRPVTGGRRWIGGGRADLWTIPVEGGQPERASDDAAKEGSPMWSSDGRFLYYVSNRNGSSALWRTRINERSGRTRGSPELVRTPFTQPSHVTRSADGRRLVWSDVRPVERNLRVMFDADARRTRGAPTELAPGEADYENVQPTIDLSRADPGPGPSPPAEPPAASFPGHWSPDGKFFAGTASGSIWLYTAATRSYDQFRPGKHPVWLNDSRRIIYADGGRLFIADVMLRISRELFAMPDQQLDYPRLSRDNLHLYFTHTGVDANLWMMTLQGSGL